MKELTAEQKKLIDELGECEERIGQLDPDIARVKVIKEQINTWITDEAADKPVVLQGNVFDSVAGVRKKERKIVAMDKVFAVLGKAKFIGLCSFPLGILDKVIPNSKAAGLVVEERTGARQIETVRRVADQPARKAA